jgi:uncharacterized protein YeaO (DUF488 family)
MSPPDQSSAPEPRENPQTPRVRVARVSDPGGPTGAYRVLVDRLWPRGLRKDDADFDEWCKEVAPSADLRRWYGHQRDRFDEFARRYQSELGDPERQAALVGLRRVADQRHLTLLTATHDLELSHAQVLAKVLRDAPS